MASFFRGTSCTKLSKDIFRTQSYIQDGPFVKIVGGFKVGLSPSKQICVISLIESPLKIMNKMLFISS